MWILLVCRQTAQARPEGAFQALVGLGCEIESLDFWEDFSQLEQRTPPAVVMIEVGDDMDASRAVLHRMSREPSLEGTPVLAAISVRALQRLAPDDAFDDFVLMPFVPAELYGRIRRLEWQASSYASNERIKVGELLIDLAAREVKLAGKRVAFTPQEFELLAFLSSRRNRVLTRALLLKEVWQQQSSNTRTVDIHIRRVRAKLGALGELIETVHGSGYLFRVGAS